MGLYISERIRKREFGKLIPPADKAALLHGARPDLAKPLAGEDLPKGTRLLKVYATTKRGPRRILYLLAVAEGDLLVLFYRDKKDSVGENMSRKNAAFNAELNRHVDLLREDILENRVEEILPG